MEKNSTLPVLALLTDLSRIASVFESENFGGLRNF